MNVPDNVDFACVARHLIDFRDEMRRDLRELREDVDKLTVIVRSLRHEVDLTGAIVLRIERRLERLEETR